MKICVPWINKKKCWNNEYCVNEELIKTALIYALMNAPYFYYKKKPIPVISKNPSCIFTVISEGAKWLTSRLIFHLHFSLATSDNPPLISLYSLEMFCPAAWLKGASAGDRKYPGQADVPSLLRIPSIQLRSLGSNNGGRPKCWLKISLGHL